jgi:murein DD-endopeptidase MepM/ murein hydrolase activator NlpD
VSAPPTARAPAGLRRSPSPLDAAAHAPPSLIRAPAPMHPPVGPCLRVVVALAALMLAAVIARPIPVGAQGEQVTYRPPVLAPITDHFRAPDHPYGPGNRGIDYATQPGTAVTAAADGRVTFAGPVAGRLIVVIAHRDGLRTTYDDLAEIAVSPGQAVAAGARVGTAGSHLHFGARDGNTYVDPELLFAAGARAASVGIVVRLVPEDGRPARGAASRRGARAPRASPRRRLSSCGTEPPARR